MNKFFVSGYLVKDPEKKQDDKGLKYYLINLADNLFNHITNYLEFALFDEKEFIGCQNIKKGDKILVEGYIRNRRIRREKDKLNYFTNSLYISHIEIFKPIITNISESTKPTESIKPTKKTK